MRTPPPTGAPARRQRRPPPPVAATGSAAATKYTGTTASGDRSTPGTPCGQRRSRSSYEEDQPAPAGTAAPRMLNDRYHAVDRHHPAMVLEPDRDQSRRTGTCRSTSRSATRQIKPAEHGIGQTPLAQQHERRTPAGGRARFCAIAHRANACSGPAMRLVGVRCGPRTSSPAVARQLSRLGDLVEGRATAPVHSSLDDRPPLRSDACQP